MIIRDIHALRGPNYWSVNRHKLIVMVLDIGDMEQRPTNTIDGFHERIKEKLPTLYEHSCSEGCPGGFFMRVEAGTWIGHVIEHIALEIQTLAGMDTGFGRTRGYGEEGVYNVVFSYMEEEVGLYSAKAAVRLAMALVENKPYDLEADIQIMRQIREKVRLGPSTGSIIEEAEARNIPWMRLNQNSLCQLGYGVNQKRIQATVTSQTSNIGVEIACDKEDTKFLLEKSEVPVPRGEIIRTEEELKASVNYIGYPLVIKPVSGNHGRGITTNIQTWNEALHGFASAKLISNAIIIERYLEGEDYRLLVINYKLVAASIRTAAHIVGDGKTTIQGLIDLTNQDPKRGYGHEKVLTLIEVNDMTLNILEEKGLTPLSVLNDGEVLKLKDTANLSTGGTAEDVTDLVHPYNIFMAERIAKIIDLDICGIDIITTDIGQPLPETGGAVLEVNAGPGFRMHLSPTKGLPRNVAGHVLDMLYPLGSSSRIPIIAVAGTNGKTTTTRLIAHMARMKGYKVGYTTTDGVYIQNRLMMAGDCTGPASAEFVLKDPTVDFAVLESARGGLLRAGLAFKNCDIGIVTNVAADHLGLKGIETIEQLARVKSVIPDTVFPHGYAILNADDDLVYEMRESVKSNVALFSLDENNERIIKHGKSGGLYAIYENGYITICKGEWKMRVSKAINVPLTFEGKAIFMIQNLLPAVLAGYIENFSIEDMKLALESFVPSPALTPGRLNMFRFRHFDVLVDYAHNPAGLSALKQMIDKMDGYPKVGIIAGIGDRRVEDNIEIGAVAASMFDKVIIRQDKNLRGKTEDEIIEMVYSGIKSVDPNKPVSIITQENEAVAIAINTAEEGSLLVLCTDAVQESLQLIMKFKEDEAKRLYDFE
ncbi:cyanophycin synthetase [Fulvivirga sediminis]|uniref:Cyanophycin synthetase n=1 Tax=Fulvivirga sediminis TaxID=2803949 RepID=A0A937K1X0_9BACT|nr:cyanophycin synthetase [Fulvivirga sediminis]MBL3657162.1 cyanophycin synthetase [Fulvivirga sediminis]